ncbi:MAG: endonuclease [Clostridiales bacterium]|nr:endonuclease [Clostridiales bacterium]
MKKFWKILRTILIVVLCVVVLAALAFVALTLFEYKPADTEAVTPPDGTRVVKVGDTLKIMTYNIGYAGLGEEEDFFMDGGKKTRPDSAEIVEKNLNGIIEELKAAGADIFLLQEVDTGSKRSYKIDETKRISEALGLPFDFAYNFHSVYTPIPFPDTMGRVMSGLATYTSLSVSSAERIQLPCPFSWPVRAFNLKRCLLINRMPIEGSDKELVIINLHLEAYDDGEGKIAQTKMLYEVLKAEAAKGNYVVVGGDFNQTFPGASRFEPIEEGLWAPGTLSNDLPEGFSFFFDAETPTCRSLDTALAGNPDPQYYIIDGFIVSANITVESLEVIKTGFDNSDHQPLVIVITLN